MTLRFKVFKVPLRETTENSALDRKAVVVALQKQDASLSYLERCKLIHLNTLEHRQTACDILYIFKTLNNLDAATSNSPASNLLNPARVATLLFLNTLGLAN
uniref:Uncharacterized protein n=1 Tax=Panagrellus redivivus TaxID=6233 RepID=A0A7E4V9K9_PANRE